VRPRCSVRHVPPPLGHDRLTALATG
jgi:hypothetical protein